MTDEADEQERAIRAAAGLCGTCAQSRAIRSGRGSIFLRCERGLRKEAGFPKYPPLPIVRCSGWVVAGPEND